MRMYLPLLTAKDKEDEKNNKKNGCSNSDINQQPKNTENLSLIYL
jgi:hypothetical protein